MLPAANRMRSAEAFAATIKGGRRSGNRMLVVHAVGGDPEADLLVGFTVSKRVGNSVVRHRVVRRLRHVMQDLLPDIKAQSIVVRALPASSLATSDQLRDALLREFKRLGVLA